MIKSTLACTAITCATVIFAAAAGFSGVASANALNALPLPPSTYYPVDLNPAVNPPPVQPVKTGTISGYIVVGCNANGTPIVQDAAGNQVSLNNYNGPNPCLPPITPPNGGYGQYIQP